MIGVREDIATIIGAVVIIMSFNPGEVHSNPRPLGVTYEIQYRRPAVPFNACEYIQMDILLKDLKAVGKDIT